MWTSRIIQTLTTLSQPKCAYCASPQDLYTITLFLFIYSIQINNEKKGWPDWLTHSGQYGWPQLHRVQILLTMTPFRLNLKICDESKPWLDCSDWALIIEKIYEVFYLSFFACTYLNYRVFLVIKKFSRDKLPDNLKYFWDDFSETPCNRFEFDFLHWKLCYN